MNDFFPRLRFAPAPTGNMHLGNIRTALMNYLFARQKGGIFVLRVEDTDAERNFDPNALKIQQDLAWLRLSHDEGPEKNERYGPYLQSQRTQFYQEKLSFLIKKNFVYRCFCNTELLEQKRLRAQALGKPPRYDKTCRMLDQATIEEKLLKKASFIWRFELNPDQTIAIADLAKGTINFEMKHFSDFPLTRNDGSFTFIFANCVDDIAMRISHIFRGEEHITNTACQGPLFQAFNANVPSYWHMPLLCNIDGKKLSKRDFGFSLKDLQQEGFLPEAINNYLAIIGGGNFRQEIFSLDELIHAVSFDHMHTTGHIKYDVEKLRWTNRKWIQKITTSDFIQRVEPFIIKRFGEKIKTLLKATYFEKAAQVAQSEITLLSEAPEHLAFIFDYETIFQTIIAKLSAFKTYESLIALLVAQPDTERYIKTIKEFCATNNINPKEAYAFVRLCLTGNSQGPAIADIALILGAETIQSRLSQCLTILSN